MDIQKILVKSSKRLTKDEEKERITRWRETGDNEILGPVIHGRVPWILRKVIDGTPDWADRDTILSDCISECFLALKNFDTSRGLTAYLSTVVRRVIGDAMSSTTEQVEIDLNKVIDETRGDATPIIDEIKYLMAAAPPEELNTNSRLIIKRILSGVSRNVISNQMEWTYDETKRNVEHYRRFIAYKMREAGVSAAPWVCDRYRDRLAAEYEASMKMPFIDD